MTCTYLTAGQHEFVIPDDVDSLDVSAIGGHGGADNLGRAGGLAGTASSRLNGLTGTLFVLVGGNGTNGVVGGRPEKKVRQSRYSDESPTRGQGLVHVRRVVSA
ncbi:hypothetical protein [Lolliginicoccus suaedae]|uniref:hypothetical protein n=1 Tax=Lolliginicoccus suaedae TaxID=2605429 RepID=UPI0011EE5843|nr:hypothetical protein [Lolliginicoccus suaedae]